MKAILVDAREDGGFDTRLSAALAVRGAFDGHLTFLQATPYDALILGDPFGGVYALPTIIDDLRAAAARHRTAAEARLGDGGPGWTWLQEDGQPADRLIRHSRLADIAILSLPGGEKAPPTAMIDVAQLALHARAPVLAVPCEGPPFNPLGSAVVAWNGSAEASHAVRLARPLLAKASAVHIVTISDEEGGWPAQAAADYLARYGIAVDLHKVPASGDVADTLLDHATARRAAYVVMGAYGHSRFRETMLGGATRALLNRSNVPLILAH